MTVIIISSHVVPKIKEERSWKELMFGLEGLRGVYGRLFRDQKLFEYKEFQDCGHLGGSLRPPPRTRSPGLYHRTDMTKPVFTWHMMIFSVKDHQAAVEDQRKRALLQLQLLCLRASTLRYTRVATVSSAISYRCCVLISNSTTACLSLYRRGQHTHGWSLRELGRAWRLFTFRLNVSRLKHKFRPGFSQGKKQCTKLRGGSGQT